MIIDYILVGCSAGLTGIFLSEKLRGKGITTPIIFLSREKPNQPEITINLNKNLEPFKWIHKGYDGREILDEEYFKSDVIKEIEKCFRKSSLQMIDIIITDSGSSDDFIDDLKELREKIISTRQYKLLEKYLEK